MDAAVKSILEPLLEFQEQRRRLPYDDATGKPLHKGDTIQGFITVGVGRNLSAKGLYTDEIQLCMENDERDAEGDAIYLLGLNVYASLTPNRKAAILSWVFNVGRAHAMTFVKFIQAVKSSDFRTAKTEWLTSQWARQVGPRAVTLADMLLKG